MGPAKERDKGKQRYSLGWERQACKPRHVITMCPSWSNLSLFCSRDAKGPAGPWCQGDCTSTLPGMWAGWSTWELESEGTLGTSLPKWKGPHSQSSLPWSPSPFATVFLLILCPSTASSNTVYLLGNQKEKRCWQLGCFSKRKKEKL